MILRRKYFNFHFNCNFTFIVTLTFIFIQFFCLWFLELFTAWMSLLLLFSTEHSPDLKVSWNILSSYYKYFLYQIILLSFDIQSEKCFFFFIVYSFSTDFSSPFCFISIYFIPLYSTIIFIYFLLVFLVFYLIFF